MKVYLDNTILECRLKGENGNENCDKIIKLLESGKIEGWTSSLVKANVLTNLDDGSNEKELRDKFRRLVEIPLRQNITEQLPDSKSRFPFNVHILSAKQFKIDCIVTLKKDEYKNRDITIVTPEELLEKMGSTDDKNQVPFLDLKAQHHYIYNEIDDKVTDIIANTGFILGKYVEEFEQKFAELQEVQYCLGVSSGTDALHIALQALEIGYGDEVIVPVNTFIATAEAVSHVGSTPVFIDCDEYYNINVNKLKNVLEERRNSGEFKVKAIIPVHLYGQPANMTEIMKLAEDYEFYIVEDACQAHLAKYNGKRVGNFSQISAFSFYPGKNLGAYGEAGAVVTNDEELFKKAKMYRQHGEIERYHHSVIGHNYRMEAIQGAVLSTKVKYLSEWTQKRQRNAVLYSESLKDINEVKIPLELEETECVYHLYVLQVENRDSLQKFLKEKNIATGLHYPIPLHLQQAYSSLGYKKGDFPITEGAAESILSLPMFPELSKRQIRYVCDKISEFYSQ